MKNILLPLFLLSVLCLASCNRMPKVTMQTQIDTLSYKMGISCSEGICEYLAYEMGVDTAYMKDFIKGFLEGSNRLTPEDRAYMAGLQIGNNVGGRYYNDQDNTIFGKNSKEHLNRDNMLAGFLRGMRENNAMVMVEASGYVRIHTESLKEQMAEQRNADAIAQGKAFLNENAQKEGVVTTASGLQYKVLTQGDGPVPTPDSQVQVHYKGMFLDGTVFEDSHINSQPTTFTVSNVIDGWAEALCLMPVGSKWMLYIPSELAYGSRDTGKIPPYSTLMFEVELINITE